MQVNSPNGQLKSLGSPVSHDTGNAEVGTSDQDLNTTLTNPPTEVHGGQSASSLPVEQKSFVQMVEKVGTVEGDSSRGQLVKSIKKGSPIAQPSLEQFLTLPFPVKSGTLTDTTDGMFETLSLPSDLFAINRLWDKLRNVFMIRFDLEVTVKFNIAPFHFGYVRIVHFPCGAGIDSASESTSGAHINFPTMMQMNGVDVYFPAQNNGSFIVPWSIPYPWIRLNDYADPATMVTAHHISELARVKMFVAAPLNSANGTVQPVPYTVFVRILNPQWTNMVPQIAEYFAPSYDPITVLNWPVTEYFSNIALSEPQIEWPEDNEKDEGIAEVGAESNFCVGQQKIIEDGVVNGEVFPSFLHLCQRPQYLGTILVNSYTSETWRADPYVSITTAVSPGQNITNMTYYSRMFRFQRGGFGCYVFRARDGLVWFNKQLVSNIAPSLFQSQAVQHAPQFDSNAVVMSADHSGLSFASVPFQTQMLAIPFDDNPDILYPALNHNVIELTVKNMTAVNGDYEFAMAAKDDWCPQFWIGAPSLIIPKNNFGKSSLY